MRSPSPRRAKGGKNKLTHKSPIKKVLKGKGAANDKGKKRNMTLEDIADYLEWIVFEEASPKKASPKKASPKKASPKKALPKQPCLPLNPRQKELLKVMRSIRNLGL